MKTWILSLVFWVMLSLFTVIDSQAQENIFFLDNIEVDSGDYYLIYKDLKNRVILYDDPKILVEYQNQLFIRPVDGALDDYVTLYHRNGQEIYSSHIGDLVFIPNTMRSLGKPLIQDETHYSEQAYKARIEQLKSTLGVTSVSLWSDEPYDFSIPNANNLITIRFPLMIVKTDSNFNSTEQLQKLEERLANELQQHGISDIGIERTLVRPINNHLSDRIILHSDYQPLIARHPRIIDTDKLVLMSHQAYIFIMQLHCVANCNEKIDKLNPLNWLETEVSHAEAIRQVRKIARQEKPWANRWRFNRHKLFSEAYNDEDLGLGYPIVQNNYQLSGFIRHEPRKLKLRWHFDLESALQGDLPGVLLNPSSH